jgi:hypothetical protein
MHDDFPVRTDPSQDRRGAARDGHDVCDEAVPLAGNEGSDAHSSFAGRCHGGDAALLGARAALATYDRR